MQKWRQFLIFYPCLLILIIFHQWTTLDKSVAMATRNPLFPIFEFRHFTNTQSGKVRRFKFSCFSRLGAAFKKPEGAASTPPLPVRLGLRLKFNRILSGFITIITCLQNYLQQLTHSQTHYLYSPPKRLNLIQARLFLPFKGPRGGDL